MRRMQTGALLCAAVMTAGPLLCAAQQPPGPVTVLNSQSVWHSFPVLKPPVVELDTGIVPLTSVKVWLDKETPAAPAGWTGEDFSDASWLRSTARTFPRTPYLANLSMRARFEVTDPAHVKDLKLTVAYYGGAIVYVNGREIARGNLPPGVRGPSALAESYRANAFVAENGALIPSNPWSGPYQPVLAAREREIADLPIPAGVLRRGVNILAVEVIRAPYHKILGEERYRPSNREVKDFNCPYDFCWYTCELRDVTLRAGAPDGLVPNAARTPELQAWNSDPLSIDVVTDLGDRCEPLRPVAIRGPKNGWSSGKVVIGSPKAIEGLKVTLGDLKQGTSSLPASAMRARYAVSYGNRADSPLDTLLEEPLDTFPAMREGCVVPIWLTVKVPKDAKPGMYTGQARVEVKGEQPLTVPLSLEVADFAVPSTQEYRTWMELMQSPDTLAAYYDIPLWSAKHWELMGESFRYMGEIGSRVVHIPLIAQANYGNAESMVRWIRNADGTTAYDFSIMDKYLDLAAAKMGKPEMVVFTAWEIYLQAPSREVKMPADTTSWAGMEQSWAAARWNLRDKGPAVTALDRTSGETRTVNLPRFEDPAAQGLWKPLFDELHRKMAARGLEDAMRLGMASDAWPTKAELSVLQEVSGNLPWVMHTHGGNRVGTKMHGIAPVDYVAYVWNVGYPKDPGKQYYGWKRPELYAEFRRFGSLSDWPPATTMLFPELQITGTQRGLGRVGADFWPVYRDRQGRRSGRVWERYPQSLWHSCNLFSHLLLPGPDGPVASARYEQMREGVQQCEARIAIERVLTDEALRAKLPADLAARCQALLDDRVWEELKAFSDLQLTYRMFATSANNFYYGCGGLPGHYWYASSGWQDRAQKLYGLAGEVERKLAAP